MSFEHISSERESGKWKAIKKQYIERLEDIPLSPKTTFSLGFWSLLDPEQMFCRYFLGEILIILLKIWSISFFNLMHSSMEKKTWGFGII